MFDGWIELAEKQLALGKVQQEWYFHLVVSHKLFIARLLPAFTIVTHCVVTTDLHIYTLDTITSYSSHVKSYEKYGTR